LAERYRALAARARALTAAGAADPPDGADALRALATAVLPVYAAIADDPSLPAELLPPAWPAGEVGAALDGALRAFGPAVSLHVDDRRQLAQARRRPAA
ncbi:MAG TPA: PaaX family transcriptional regulator C-terminal domain-containing protein, partial [Solirubrobacteraceae bacterium]|nr:PaaX family transcriptional regulator C-terminal domain-containing protein [Solirubrobacteraceae bacterium]